MAGNGACEKHEIPYVSVSGTLDPRIFLPTLPPLCVAHLMARSGRGGVLRRVRASRGDSTASRLIHPSAWKKSILGSWQYRVEFHDAPKIPTPQVSFNAGRRSYVPSLDKRGGLRPAGQARL